MDGMPTVPGFRPPVIRVECCGKCKYRELDVNGQARCHEGPPQRSAFLMPTDNGLVVKVLVAFPEVKDDDYCHRYKMRLKVS